MSLYRYISLYYASVTINKMASCGFHDERKGISLISEQAFWYFNLLEGYRVIDYVPVVVRTEKFLLFVFRLRLPIM